MSSSWPGSPIEEGGDHHDIISIRPVNNPKNATAEIRDGLEGSRNPRIARVWLGSIRSQNRRLDPLSTQTSLGQGAFGVDGKTDHG